METVVASRPDALRRFLSALQSAFCANVNDPRAQALLARIFGSLRTVAQPHPPTPVRLPVCRYLAPALEAARCRDAALRTLAETLLEIEPSLAWRRREGSGPSASANFRDGHANAMIVGPGGLEPRTDVWLGVSLLAPNVRYPDHSHPPEETYLVMSRGEFRQGDDGWSEPGFAGSFYNPPNITHAMRSGSDPLLAFWALWTTGQV